MYNMQAGHLRPARQDVQDPLHMLRQPWPFPHLQKELLMLCQSPDVLTADSSHVVHQAHCHGALTDWDQLSQDLQVFSGISLESCCKV